MPIQTGTVSRLSKIYETIFIPFAECDLATDLNKKYMAILSPMNSTKAKIIVKIC